MPKPDETWDVSPGVPTAIIESMRRSWRWNRWAALCAGFVSVVRGRSDNLEPMQLVVSACQVFEIVTG